MTFLFKKQKTNEPIRLPKLAIDKAYRFTF